MQILSLIAHVSDPISYHTLDTCSVYILTFKVYMKGCTTDCQEHKLVLGTSLSIARCLLHTPTCTKRVTQKDQPGNTFQLYIWFCLNLQQNWLTALPDSPKWINVVLQIFWDILHFSWPQLYVTLLTPCPRLNIYQLPSCKHYTDCFQRPQPDPRSPNTSWPLSYHAACPSFIS